MVHPDEKLVPDDLGPTDLPEDQGKALSAPGPVGHVSSETHLDAMQIALDTQAKELLRESKGGEFNVLRLRNPEWKPDFHDEDLSHSRLPSVDLHDAKLQGVTFDQADLACANFQNAELGKGTSFKNCDLTGCDFRGVGFQGADKALFERADTQNARVDAVEVEEFLSPDQLKQISWLTPEQAAKTLKTLESRFNSGAGKKLHKGLKWEKVKAALVDNHKALWSISGMEAQGHEPNVYFSDEKGFDVGTCSKNPPESGNNSLYSEEEVAGLSKLPYPYIDPQVRNVVAMAKKLGVDVMTPLQYKALQKNDQFDYMQVGCWLKTDEQVIRDGWVALGYRGANRANGEHSVFVPNIFHPDRARRSFIYPGTDHSWRGSLRINWAS